MAGNTTVSEFLKSNGVIEHCCITLQLDGKEVSNIRLDARTINGFFRKNRQKVQLGRGHFGTVFTYMGTCKEEEHGTKSKYKVAIKKIVLDAERTVEVELAMKKQEFENFAKMKNHPCIIEYYRELVGFTMWVGFRVWVDS